MTFIARIKRGSAVWNMWKAQKRVGGAVASVHFQIVHSGDFETSELSADQVIELHKADSVELIATGKLPDVSVYVFSEEEPVTVEILNEPSTEPQSFNTVASRPRGRPPKQSPVSPFAPVS